MKSTTRAAPSLISKIALPPTFKLGIVLSSGAASYFTFKTSRLIWRGTQLSSSKPDSPLWRKVITIKQNPSGSFTASSPLEGLENKEYLSNLIDILNGILNIQVCVFILKNLIIFFIIMKKISEINFNFEWLSKYKYGNRIKNFLIKIQNS